MGAQGCGYTLGPEPESPCLLPSLGSAHLLPGAPDEMQIGCDVGPRALCRVKHRREFQPRAGGAKNWQLCGPARLPGPEGPLGHRWSSLRVGTWVL